MRMMTALLISLLPLACLSCRERQSVLSVKNRKPEPHGDRTADTDCLRKYLVRLVRFHESEREQHTFRVHFPPERDDLAYVHWVEEAVILHPKLPTEEELELPGDHFYYWEVHKAGIDLKTEVVPKGEVGGSSYLVEQDWVDEWIRKCHASGIQIVIDKSDANKESQALPE